MLQKINLSYKERKNCELNKVDHPDKIYDILLNGSVTGTLIPPRASANDEAEHWKVIILTAEQHNPDKFDYGIADEDGEKTLEGTKKYVQNLIDDMSYDYLFYGNYYKVDFTTRENLDHDIAFEGMIELKKNGKNESKY